MKTLKTPKHKIAPKKTAKKAAPAVILVGTYKERQLAFIEREGVYNYPIGADDKLKPEDAAQVKELWLYAGRTKTARQVFEATFVGIQSREEFLAAHPTYPKSKSAHTRYLVFKAKKLDYGTRLDDQLVFARASDFTTGKSAKIAAAIKAYEADGDYARIADYLPEELAAVPKHQLRVCEAAVQLDFLISLNMAPGSLPRKPLQKDAVRIEFGDSYELCKSWLPPTVIVSDGPYGLKSYPGDPATPEGLADFYRPFLSRWYELSLPSTTLWFWNSEQGWANCHRMIESCGWEFRNCHIWNKGISHIAGNCNTKTIRKYPVVTEVCAQYVRKNTLTSNGRSLSLRDWMREEWKRTKLPFRLTNQACGVKDAATRKYFSTDHLWYFPPSEAFVKIAAYANEHGAISGRPYFARPDGQLFSPEEWNLMRAKFHCEIGVSNVWNLSAVRGAERIMDGRSCLHMNQKPLELLELIIRSSSDEGDVVWEPFGGLCSTAVAACRTRRQAFSAEINPIFFESAKERLCHEEI